MNGCGLLTYLIKGRRVVDLAHDDTGGRLILVRVVVNDVQLFAIDGKRPGIDEIALAVAGHNLRISGDWGRKKSICQNPVDFNEESHFR